MRWVNRSSLERLIGPLGLMIVVLMPAIQWIVSSVQIGSFQVTNPYSFYDLQFTVVITILIVIYEAVAKQRSFVNVGDESKIISNRNESDYYEIWEEVHGFRVVRIDALGHSFNTLWFNFIKKYLYELAANDRHFDQVTIRLVATKKNPGSFADIRAFYERLEVGLAKKITIKLYVNPIDQFFFTGLAVNESALWLSIREPQSVKKGNEHVREWRRNRGGTAEMMVNWYMGVVDTLAVAVDCEELRVVTPI